MSSLSRLLGALQSAASGPASITGAGQIASAEVFGAAVVGSGIVAAGVATGEAFGSAGIAAGVASAGVESGEALGSAVVGAGVVSSGIGTAEAFGAPTLSGAEAAQTGAGSRRRHKTLAEYEAEWALAKLEQVPPEVIAELPSRVRKKVTRKAAREVYFLDSPVVERPYVDALKDQRYQAEMAEIRALLDLSTQVSETRAAIAHAALAIARKKQAKAARELEELDVLWVAAVLMET